MRIKKFLHSLICLFLTSFLKGNQFFPDCNVRFNGGFEVTGTRTKPDCNVRFNGGFEVTGTRTKIKLVSFFCDYLPCSQHGSFFEEVTMNIYRKPNPKEEVGLRRHFNFIYDIAEFYLENLADKDIYVCTETDVIKTRFSKNSIFHLIGIKHRQGNRQFWLDINNKRLKSDNVLIQNYTLRKLQVMREFPNLFQGDSYLTRGFELQTVSFDKAIRTRRLILAVGLGERNNTFFPQTAIDIRGNMKYQKIGKKVEEIYYIDYSCGRKIYLKSKYKQ